MALDCEILLKMKKTAILIGLQVVFLPGCISYWDGTLSSNLSVSPAQYHQIGKANGEAKTFVLFGLIGGNEHSNLVNEAKGDLIRAHPLDSNMYFADWSVSFQKRIHLLGVEQICRVNAGIFSLTKTSKRYDPPLLVAPVLKPIFTQEPAELKNGDRVEFYLEGQKVQGTILKLDGNTVKINYLDSENILRKTNRFKTEVKKMR